MIDQKKRTSFIRHLLSDINALEWMIANNKIENDVVRIGAEQEFCLVTDSWRPSKSSQEILKVIDDNHFTTELAKYNLEINLDPEELKGNCFTTVQNQLTELLTKAEHAAKKYNNNVILTGILPTIGKNELGMDYLTPRSRYQNINSITKELRGGDFELHLSGVDELSIQHDSVLFEACNTSFQMHLQIPSTDFISSYNWAQAISGPVLSVCTNSPLLLGRELWSETRIALFQQSLDTRGSSRALKERQPRVTIGNHWSSGTAADIFKNDVALYEVLLTKEITNNAMEELAAGRIPKLQALSLHNGTIYRWNRACYGVGNGKPHLRIENRYIPAGPSVIDQMANFAFWVGLMKGRPKAFDDMSSQMDFRDARANFINAARTGKDSALHWNGRQVPVPELITNELLPMAYSGLEKSGVDKQDIEKLLGIVERRTNGQTGTKWIIKNYRNLRKSLKTDDALITIAGNINANQENKNFPVHQWPMIDHGDEKKETAHLVSHIMSTRLYIINENDLAELATNVMEWKDIHHMPVENSSGELRGLLTWTHMERYKNLEAQDESLLVSQIMTKNVITVQHDTEIKQAIQLMKKLEYGCLPVMQDGHLIGIITIKDVIPFDHD
ncbi:MAG: CBS domain-containing protein [Reichenbachiella sp.]|uniref:CBS domain-containing protein n=1 Tax=Reichenbachiella sp. TaxID=2184521 RepID=UPI0032997E40